MCLIFKVICNLVDVHQVVLLSMWNVLRYHDKLCLLFLFITVCATVKIDDGKAICSEIPEKALQEILGAAFNARYMSVKLPTMDINSESGKKRSGIDLDFYVDEKYHEDLEDQPAWTLKNHVGTGARKRVRYRRDLGYLQEWHCNSRIKWTDLGPDYFPRYLRSVECLAENCWFNIYKCRPKSFTVKVLKRKRDKCIIAGSGTKTGISSLPKELKELWVWEERAVNFCCDCTN